MTYVEGFVTAVPTANKTDYQAHAEKAVELFKGLGATRLVEAWGDDVPRGKVNDLYGAVQAKDDETVLFSWIEYPDKATRDAAVEKMTSDPAMAEMGKDMPFDGSRMIWGGFDSVHDEGSGNGVGYVDGVVMPVRADGKAAYGRHASAAAPAFLENGALRVVDAFADDVQDGKQTDFNRAIHRQDGEVAGYGWIEWPSKEVRDAAWPKVMEHPAMKEAGEPPFDGKRMMFGGFRPIVDK